MRRLLVIEDDPAIRTGLLEALSREHFDVRTVADGEEGYRIARSEPFDLILLDVMLPSMNGDDLCRALRRDGIDVPIIMLTARGEEVDRILGLELGADDYVTKPFSIRELIARVRAVMRRGKGNLPLLDEFSFGRVHLDFRRHEATCGGADLQLTALEFKVLKYLVEREGEVVSREMLLNDVWGYDAFPTTRTVDNIMLSLRKKIEEEPSAPRYLLTVPRVGYRFVRAGAAVEEASE